MITKAEKTPDHLLGCSLTLEQLLTYVVKLRKEVENCERRLERRTEMIEKRNGELWEMFLTEKEAKETILLFGKQLAKHAHRLEEEITDLGDLLS